MVQFLDAKGAELFANKIKGNTSLIDGHTSILLSGFQLIYYINPPSTNSVPIQPLHNGDSSIFGNIPVTLPTGFNDYVIKIYGSCGGDETGTVAKLMIEVISHSSKTIKISYNGKQIASASRAAHCPLVASVDFTDFVKGKGFVVEMS